MIRARTDSSEIEFKELSLRFTNLSPASLLIVWSVKRQQFDMLSSFSWLKVFNMFEMPLSVTVLLLMFSEVILENKVIFSMSKSSIM